MKESMVIDRSSSQDCSSKRHFHWTKKIGSEEDEAAEDRTAPTAPDKKKTDTKKAVSSAAAAPSLSPALKKKLQAVAVTRLRSVLVAAFRTRFGSPIGLGNRVVGTLFGNRKGHVHFALQKDPAAPPALLVELTTPISGLVKEMTSGLVRISLESDKATEPPLKRLLEEPMWRAYCNGKRCGFAARRECGPREWKVLKAVEMISTGAGVLPAGSGDGPDHDEEIMYMRAKFERIVGSRDCEAFYMMNPDRNGSPELSVYLLRL
ncbi:hypothetical protein SAY86_024795 [Trapa natans]|uniref:Protein MIZU-KUSSEI 1 n=1 Tax=Trapa natans TaxID=22666 RepID=A0AAN7REL6_TRANT|nr:hypothetical protein SAY86_024795 [Trapa natans]